MIDRKRAMEAYVEAERMRRETAWYAAARRCVHPAWLTAAIVLGAWALAEALRAVL